MGKSDYKLMYDEWKNPKDMVLSLKNCFENNSYVADSNMDDLDKRVNFLLNKTNINQDNGQLPGYNDLYIVSPERTMKYIYTSKEKNIAIKIANEFIGHLREQPDYGEREKQIQDKMNKIGDNK